MSGAHAVWWVSVWGDEGAAMDGSAASLAARPGVMMLSSAELDRPPNLDQPTKVIIATSPRSGSHMLCRLMLRAGLGIPHEYFNPLHVRLLANRWKLVQPKGAATPEAREAFRHDFVRELIARRHMNGVFGAKVQFWEHQNFLLGNAGSMLYSGARFIHLVREDALGQAVSWHAARVTGKWGLDDAVTSHPIKGGDVGNVDGIDRALNDILDEDRGWRRFFAINNIQPLRVAYEDLCAEPSGNVVRIAKHIGYSRHLHQGYEEPHEPSGGAKAEVRSRFIASKRTIGK